MLTDPVGRSGPATKRAVSSARRCMRRVARRVATCWEDTLTTVAQATHRGTHVGGEGVGGVRGGSSVGGGAE